MSFLLGVIYNDSFAGDGSMIPKQVTRFLSNQNQIQFPGFRAAGVIAAVKLGGTPFQRTDAAERYSKIAKK
jgi:hypothetical protein